jgi:HTH-type transcriptional regulator/antitoxin HipB
MKLINSAIMKKEMKKYSFDQIKDEFIGKKGSIIRDQYEYDLKMEVLGELIKQTRKERNLTQEQLGELIGVQKAQISRLENHTGNVTLSTIIKVFSSLKAKIKIQVELEGNRIQIA